MEVFFKKSQSAGSIQRMICWWPKTQKKAMKSVQAAKAKSSSYANLPTNRCSPSRNNASSRGLQHPKLNKEPGDTGHLHPSNLYSLVALDLNL